MASLHNQSTGHGFGTSLEIKNHSGPPPAMPYFPFSFRINAGAALGNSPNFNARTRLAKQNMHLTLGPVRHHPPTSTSSSSGPFQGPTDSKRAAHGAVMVQGNCRCRVLPVAKLWLPSCVGRESPAGAAVEGAVSVLSSADNAKGFDMINRDCRHHFTRNEVRTEVSREGKGTKACDLLSRRGEHMRRRVAKKSRRERFCCNSCAYLCDGRGLD